MPGERGDSFQPGFDHPGDRVFYEGREYKVDSYNQKTNLAWLSNETDPNDFRHVNMSHLTVSWCPKQHGGKGRPVEDAA